MESLAHHAPMIALLFFFAALIVIAVWTWLPHRKQTLQALAEIPLNEDQDGRK
jgi:cbb3-type cytochrome oxidase subunit 3